MLWAVRDAEARIVDFTFGYGNPTMLLSLEECGPSVVRSGLERVAPRG